MVWYSTHSSRKIVHLISCRYITRINKQYRKTFESLEEANANGYIMCRCCTHLDHVYRKEMRRNNEFCEKNDLVMRLYNNTVFIESVEASWFITETDHKLILYHGNKIRAKDPMQEIDGYHDQNVHYKKISSFLEYIVRHDKYRIENPLRKNETSAFSIVIPQKPRKKVKHKPVIRSKRKTRAIQKAQKKKSRRQKIKRVYMLIEKLKQERLAVGNG